MRLVLNKKNLLSLLSCLVISGTAFGVDFTAAIENSATYNSKDQELNYFVNVRNLGNDSFSGPVNFLAFLLPARGSIFGETSIKGVMLKSVVINLNIGPSETSRFYVRAFLPYVPKGNYLLGGFINSTRSVVETSIDSTSSTASFNNNVTSDLISVGTIENNANNPDNRSTDLFSDTNNLNALDGASSHAWRLFRRGAVDTNGLRALFLVANLPTKKLYHASYEKGVVWRSMGSAYSTRGEMLPYDIYHQAPRFEHVPEGSHHLVTLINYNEVVNEPLSNNVDLAPFKATKISVFPSQIWKVVNANDPVVLNEAFYLQTQYAAPVAWTLDTTTLPATATVNMTAGNLQRTQALTLMGSAEGLANQTDWNLSLSAAGRNVLIPVKIFKVGSDSAVLDVASSVTATAVSPFSPEVQHLTLRNTGKSTLLWRVKSATSWVHVLGLTSGEIQAGEEETLHAAFEGRTLPIGLNSGEIVLQTNTPDGEKRIGVSLNMTMPQ